MTSYEFRPFMRYFDPNEDLHFWGDPLSGDVSFLHHGTQDSHIEMEHWEKAIPSRDYAKRRKEGLPSTFFDLCIGYHPGWRYLTGLFLEGSDYFGVVENCGWLEKFNQIEDKKLEPFSPEKGKPEKLTALFDFDGVVREFGPEYKQCVFDSIYSHARDILWEGIRYGLPVDEVESFLHSHYPFTSRELWLVDLWNAVKNFALWTSCVQKDFYEQAASYNFCFSRPYFPLLDQLKWRMAFQSQMEKDDDLYGLFDAVMDKGIHENLHPWQRKLVAQKEVQQGENFSLF